MDALVRFQEYAAAFEDFFKSDDPTVLEPFFAENAVYEILGNVPFAGRHEGRQAVISYLLGSVEGFDRRFDQRQLDVLDGPALRDGVIWMRWRVSYKTAGLPELVIDGEETVEFEGDEIIRLEDRYSPLVASLIEYWFAQFGKML